MTVKIWISFYTFGQALKNHKMKNYILIIFFILFACGSDDDGNNNNIIEVEVSDITDNGVTLDWTVPSNVQSGSSVVYKIILLGEVITDNLTSRTYTFTGLNENTNYTGSVFALDSNGNETFTDFSFTTLQNPIFNGALILNTQEQIDNFYYTSVLGLTIEGEDITNLDGLESLQFVHHFIIINNTSLENLDGLQNVQTDTDYTQQLTRLIINTNNQLQDISQLSDFTEKCKELSINDCPLLTTLEGLEFAENASFSLINLGLTELSSFANTEEIYRLFIDGLNNLTDLSGLENIQHMNYQMVIRNCLNLSSLNGLGTLDLINGLYIVNNDMLSTLEGLSFLNNSNDIELGIIDNDMLSDFCAISNWVENNNILNDDVAGELYNVADNAYNPTLEQITDGNLCSQ